MSFLRNGRRLLQDEDWGGTYEVKASNTFMYIFASMFTITFLCCLAYFTFSFDFFEFFDCCDRYCLHGTKSDEDDEEKIETFNRVLEHLH